MLNNPLFKQYTESPDFLRALDLPIGTQLDFTLLGQGEYNQNFLFTHPTTEQKLVLRINTGSQMHLDDQIGYEFSALKNLEASGRTPKALFCDSSRSILPYGTLVMEWLPGRPLDYHTDLRTAAEIFADIHCTPVPADHKLLTPAYPAKAIYEECLNMVEHYFTWDQADPAIVCLLRTLIEEIGRLPLTEPSTAPKCMVNTEVNSGNFLINDSGKSYLIDWEKPLLSEPAQDLGHFLVPPTTFWKTDVILTPEEIRDFVACYEKAVAGRMDTSSLRDRLPLFFTVTCLRGVTWCAMALREYSRPDRPLTNADTFSKIKDYINTDFLQNLLDNYVRKDFLRG
ncbi:MAG: aminoglycoside phosphotransferase family protein [Clostridia bacterium]|nr:aminoglycoside phosphotransferase family protein [Clostridia bacterium]